MRVGMVVTIAGSTSNANGDRTITGITTTTATFTLTGVTAGTGGTVTPKSAWFSISGVTPAGYNAYANCTIVSSTQLTYAVTADPGAYTVAGIVQIDHGWAVSTFGGRINAYSASAVGGIGQPETIVGLRVDGNHRAGTAGKSTVGAVYGTTSYAYNSSTGIISGTMAGAYNYAENTSTGTAGSSWGSYNYTRNVSTGTITTMVGGYNYALNSRGTATDVHGTYSLAAIGSASGDAPTVTNAYGTYNRVDVNYGTLTRGFGNYVSLEGTMTNSYGFIANAASTLTFGAGAAYELSLGHYDTSTFATTKRLAISTAGTFVFTPNGTNAVLSISTTTATFSKAIVEIKTAPTISSNVLTLDLQSSAIFAVSLNANITTMTLSNPPSSGFAASFVLEFTADGTARTVTWPAAVKWAGGTAPTLTSTNAKKDAFVFYTYDGGTTYIASIIGQNF
jgi:hypothetical protein